MCDYSSHCHHHHHRHIRRGPTGPTGYCKPIECTGITGETGPAGPEGPAGHTGPEGPAGPAGPEGPAGHTGPEGPEGPAGHTGPLCPSPYVFATSESVNRNDYIGCGNSSSDLYRNTIVVCKNCTANAMAFSIRRLADAIPYTATLWVNGIPTSLQAVIPDGSVSTSVLALGNVQLNALDLLGVQLTYPPNGALSEGCAATLCTTNN